MSNDNENNEIRLKELLANHPVLLEQFTDKDPTFRDKLLKEVDESSFTLSDWVDALIAFDQWLDQAGLTLSVQDRLAYVSCAAQSVGSHATLSHLPSLIKDFLEQYGCDRAVERTSNGQQ